MLKDFWNKITGSNLNLRPTSSTSSKPSKFGGRAFLDRRLNEARSQRSGNVTPAKSRYSNNDAQMRALEARIANMSAPQPYQPNLISFDILGNYKKAQSKATKAVNPRYNKMLKDFLSGQKQQKKTAREQFNLAKESNQLQLGQTLEESEVERGRTSEDFLSAITRLGEQEGQMQEDTGREFDVDRRALAEQNAATGMTTSMGAAAMFDQQDMRNISEERQVKEFGNQREAKNLFKERTFEDLARGDEFAKEIAQNKDKSAKFDLESYLGELAQEERAQRSDIEFKRLQDIINQTDTYEKQGRQQFLRRIAGGGHDPRDVQYTQGVYNF